MKIEICFCHQPGSVFDLFVVFCKEGFICDHFLQILFSIWAKSVRRGLLSLRLRYYWSLLSLDFLNLWSTGRPNRGCQQQTISNFHFLINNTHNSCQQRHSKSVVPGMNEWWRKYDERYDFSLYKWWRHKETLADHPDGRNRVSPPYCIGEYFQIKLDWLIK